MGPPSEDGGNLIHSTLDILLRFRLQWGRRPRTAEIPPIPEGGITG